MEMTVKEVLISARAKIADPANWTQGASAKDKYGNNVAVGSSSAACWCSVGAILSVSPPSNAIYWSAIDAMEATVPVQTVSRFNDTHTHAEVLAKFDEAIAAQGGE